MSTLERPAVFDLRGLLTSTHTPFNATEHPAQSTLFMQGQPTASVLFIEHGSVRLAVTSEDGKEAICGVLGAGAFLGEAALSDDTEYRHSAVAMAKTTTLAVTVEDLRQLLRTEVALLEGFIDHLLARRSRLEADLTDQIINDSEQRLARALLQLAGCSDADTGPRALPKISQEQLARIVGTTRSRVNAFIGKFKRLGFVKTDGDVLFINPARHYMAPRGAAAVTAGLPHGSR